LSEEKWESMDKIRGIGPWCGHLCHYFAKMSVKYDMMSKEKIEVISWEKKER
jgi:hypothetical protein